MATKGYVVRSAARDEVIPLKSIYEYEAVTLPGISSHQIGDKCRMSDGRVYHWARNGGVALVAGNLLQNAVQSPGHFSLVPYAAAAIGDLEVQLTMATTLVVKNEYANGYLWAAVTPGLGNPYRIRSNNATTVVTGVCTFKLYDPIIVAYTVAASKIAIARNPWYGVIQCPATPTGIVVGVAPVAVPATTALIEYYSWVQTWGPATILNANAAQVIGTPRMTQGTTAGGVIVAAAHGIPEVGLLMNPLQVGANEGVGCFLRISQ